jgi:hypothetical protein
MISKPDENKPNRKHNLIFVGHHHAQDNTINVNKTLALLQTNGGKEHVEIVTDITTRN